MATRALRKVGEDGRSQRIVSRYNETISTRLNPVELDAKKTRALELYKQIVGLKEKKKLQVKQLNTEIKDLEKEMDQEARSALIGAEDRETEVQELYDVEDNIVLRMRMDTGEMIGQRPATQAERQQTLGEDFQ